MMCVWVQSVPVVVVTEQMCVGDNQEGGLYGIDPTLPNAISEW
jgi:hypothetical protein